MTQPHGVRTRAPVVAGTFYPGRAESLDSMIGELIHQASAPHLATAKAIVAPHAGYVYSGEIAATAYRAMQARRHEIERVVIIGPSHRVPLHGLALPTVDTFTTPLGEVPIDDGARQRVAMLPGVTVDDHPHADEHALEVHLPFLQHILDGEWALVPIVAGRATPIDVADVLASLWGGAETLIVVSTDLSHYHDYETAAAIDRRTARSVVDRDVEAIASLDACGAVPLRGLLELSRRVGLGIELLDLRNSGDTAGDRARVVGYGAFAVA